MALDVAEHRGISRRMVVLMAVATGAVVANLYYAQPLLDLMAGDLDTSRSWLGFLVTVLQVGYALGLLFVVPLGDLLERRRMVAVLLAIAVVALAGMASAPSFATLLAWAAVVGVTSVVAHVLVPFAATLAPEAERGRVVGSVMSGLVLGILVARTVAGVVGDTFGWRTMYALAAGAMALTMIVLGRRLPRDRERARLTYPQLLRSVGRLMRDEPSLRRRSAYGALSFACFSVLWTSLTFLLSGPPYDYSERVIGLFGLIGLFGAAAASGAGRWADRHGHRGITGATIVGLLASFGLLALGGGALVPLVAGIVLLDLCSAGIHITNQSVVYALHPEARSRVNSAYMTTYFVGGSAGSASAAVAYGWAGWEAVCLVGAVYAAAALVLWLGETPSSAPEGRPR